jgi:hypothetical protein
LSGGTLAFGVGAVVTVVLAQARRFRLRGKVEVAMGIASNSVKSRNQSAGLKLRIRAKVSCAATMTSALIIAAGGPQATTPFRRICHLPRYRRARGSEQLH